MPIIKPGFSPGFRGRTLPPACNRRMYYLASQQERDSARLLGPQGQELSAVEAIEVLGGSSAAYHEIIVAPSAQECAAIRARCPSNPDSAIREASSRIAKAYAMGRPYVIGIHEQDGRFHFHLAVAGPMSERALGRHGQVQKTWNLEFLGDEPRIQDWAAHRRYKEDLARLQAILRDQKENEQQRREAVKRAAPGRKAEAAMPYERRARNLVERRYQVEIRAIQARYEARGTLGSHRHNAEMEQAEHRRTGSIRRLERRETTRQLGAAKARVGRAVDMGGRVAQKATRVAGRISGTAMDLAMKGLGVPRPLRRAARAGLVLAQEVAQTTLRAAQETAKAATRSSLHLAQASLKLGAGLVAALPTGGASLAASGKEASQDLAQAAKELGHGMFRSGAALGQGAGRAAMAGGQEVLPQEIRTAAGIVIVAGRTAANAAKDILTLSPISLGKTVAGGVLDFGKTTAHGTGVASTLPEPLRRAFQIAGWIPVVGITAKAAQLATETAQTIVNAASRGMEVH